VAIKEEKGKIFALTASYTDLGGGSTRPLSGSNVIYLRSSVIELGKMKEGNGFGKKDSAGTTYLLMPQTEGSIELNSIDLAGIKQIEFTGFGNSEPTEYSIEIRAGGEKGRSIGNGKIAFPAGKQKIILAVPVATDAIGNKQNVFIYFKKVASGNKNRTMLKTLKFVPK
jgi:hypothetical protein